MGWLSAQLHTGKHRRGSASTAAHPFPPASSTYRPKPQRSMRSAHLGLCDQHVEVEPGGGARGQRGRHRTLRRRQVVALVGRALRAAGCRENVGDAPDLRVDSGGERRGGKEGGRCEWGDQAQCAEVQEAPQGRKAEKQTRCGPAHQAEVVEVGPVEQQLTHGHLDLWQGGKGWVGDQGT